MNMITPQNIARHELIGLHIRVVQAPHQGFAIEGKVVDETKNMLTIRCEDGERRIPKDHAVFEFTLPDGSKATVEGRQIARRPEDRVRQ